MPLVAFDKGLTLKLDSLGYIFITLTLGT